MKVCIRIERETGGVAVVVVVVDDDDDIQKTRGSHYTYTFEIRSL